MKKLILSLIVFTTAVFAENVLRIPVASDPSSWDPRTSAEMPTNYMINMIYAGLMRKDAQGHLVPDLAEEHLVSEDQLTHIFILRDAKWSNGEPVTAHDFEYSWKKCIDPKTADKTAYPLFIIKNAEECFLGKLPMEDMGVQAQGDKILLVRLEYPFPNLSEATYGYMGLKAISKKMDQEHPDWIHNWKKHAVFNGPFIPKKWSRSYEIVLEKNPKYWDAKSVKMDRLRFFVLSDATTSLYMFQKGEIDWVGYPWNGIPMDMVNSKTMSHIDTTIIDYLFINTTKEPFSNKNFRKAISFAINRSEIALVTNGLKLPTTRMLNGSTAIDKTPLFEDGDIQAGKRYLEKALEELGITKDKLPPLILSIRNAEPSTTYAQAIQEQLRKVLGLHIQLSQAEWLVHCSKLSKKDYQFAEHGRACNIHDPMYILEIFKTNDALMNCSGWNSPEYKDLINKTNHEKDPFLRWKYMNQLEEMLVDELPVIPLFTRGGFFMVNPKLKGYNLTDLMADTVINYAYWE